jgi:hypothetical protein
MDFQTDSKSRSHGKVADWLQCNFAVEEVRFRVPSESFVIMLSTFARAPILASRLLAQRPLLSSTSLGSRLYSTPTSTPAPPTGLSEGERTIWSKLHKQFSPTELEVQDVSGVYSYSG